VNAFARFVTAAFSLGGVACFGPAYLEPAEGGRDFKLQGEYEGAGHGAQVVATGDGSFEAMLHAGGLPGAGAATDPPPLRASGQDEGDTVTFAGDFDAALQGGTLRVQSASGESHVLRRIERQSPTLGAKPPEGAVVLFGDGDLSAFADAELDPRGFLAAGALTREAFGSFSLHLEFRLPFMPEASGQMRANSGVYLQNRYEIQVLDSFGLTGENNECGAIYEQKAPDVNMAFPPLSWQTYDIDFTAARFDGAGQRTAPALVTVRHNGVVIHDQVAFTGPTGMGEPESVEPGPLQFQDHWNPVVYRNIWLVPR
jgi:hypothetical protein